MVSGISERPLPSIGTSRSSLSLLRRPSSLRSLRSNSSQTATNPFRASASQASFTGSQSLASPLAVRWPAAMVLGHLKAMDRAGDRAIAYGKATRDLLDAESGLHTWAAGFTQRTQRPVQPAHLELQDFAAGASLADVDAHTLTTPVDDELSHKAVGLTLPSASDSELPSGLTLSRDRNVSGASQFPMRNDGDPLARMDPTAYKAKEIDQSAVLSAPIEPVPCDLPYPSLAIMGSDSSVPSAAPLPTQPRTAAQKSGLFNAFRSGGSKKERESHRRSMDPHSRETSAGLARAHSRLSPDPSQNSPRPGPAGPRGMIRAAQTSTAAGRNSLDVHREGRMML